MRHAVAHRPVVGHAYMRAEKTCRSPHGGTHVCVPYGIADRCIRRDRRADVGIGPYESEIVEPVLDTNVFPREKAIMQT